MVRLTAAEIRIIRVVRRKQFECHVPDELGKAWITWTRIARAAGLQIGQDPALLAKGGREAGCHWHRVLRFGRAGGMVQIGLMPSWAVAAIEADIVDVLCRWRVAG